MTGYDYDLFVIGAGSGGVRAARIAASHGARVAVAEAFRVGGTCVIRGCVPKKLYVLASRFRDEFEDAKGFGWSLDEPSFEWGELVAAKEKEITRLERIYAENLARAGVAIIGQRAVVDGPHAVRLADGRHISAGKILIATGGAPTSVDIPGMELALTSNEIFDLPEFPRRLLVIGSGYIAVEFAAIFARLGASVVMSFRADLPLRGFDHDLRRLLAEALAQSGVAMLPGVTPKSLRRAPGGLTVEFANGQSGEFDAALAATGRAPATAGLGLVAAGVRLQKNGAVCVDSFSRTSVESIFAVGDVTDRINLTPVAIREGHAFADTQFGGREVKVDYDLVPSAVFTTPEIGTVGCSEEEALRRYGELAVYETSFRPMKATLSGRAERVFMKLLVDCASERVVGAHILGPEAGEMAQLIAISMKMRAKKSDFDAAMALHPTMAEELVTMRNPSRLVKAPGEQGK
ncbi:glutathione-disulfide reductase [Methylocystis heyeri]|uniref:Glutathione reductase n=1 Tax=Methylocystis heyeri TaxID=391905 RepID=A0A6B8KDM8_9HYPH|nr:glutathione-disulfide reductase [Methylocystis heyeri]QGM45799.1 glutathione-disulfide reductase [Methylocystis heyeri]